MWRARWCGGRSGGWCRWRRAEALNPLLVRYLNRASDHLFALARRLNAAAAGMCCGCPGRDGKGTARTEPLRKETAAPSLCPVCRGPSAPARNSQVFGAALRAGLSVLASAGSGSAAGGELGGDGKVRRQRPRSPPARAGVSRRPGSPWRYTRIRRTARAGSPPPPTDGRQARAGAARDRPSWSISSFSGDRRRRCGASDRVRQAPRPLPVPATRSMHPNGPRLQWSCRWKRSAAASKARGSGPWPPLSSRSPPSARRPRSRLNRLLKHRTSPRSGCSRRGASDRTPR